MATEADFHRIGNYARMYNPDQNVDHSKGSRTTPLEVICPGASRTGTLTVHKALEILGYPNPFHFSSFYDNTTDAIHWADACEAKFWGKGELPNKAFFDSMLGHVGAVTDAPCNLFAEELIAFYPDAKVVLVERDIDSWYESFMNFCDKAYAPFMSYVAKLDPDFTGRIVRIGEIITHIQAGFSSDVDQARVRSKNFYRHHYQDIRGITPPERLLNFKLSDGWRPLCEFLGKPVPDVPFPHVNDGKSNGQSFVELVQIALKRIDRRMSGHNS